MRPKYRQLRLDSAWNLPIAVLREPHLPAWVRDGACLRCEWRRRTTNYFVNAGSQQSDRSSTEWPNRRVTEQRPRWIAHSRSQLRSRKRELRPARTTSTLQEMASVSLCSQPIAREFFSWSAFTEFPALSPRKLPVKCCAGLRTKPMLASTPSVRRILELAILLLVSIEFPPSPSRTVSAHTADRRVSRVRIGVLGLFHSKQMTINAIAGHALLLNAGEDLTVLESTSGVTSATIQLSGSNVVANAGNRVFRSSELRVSGRDGEPVYFQLAVPNKIARRYQGVLEIKSVGSELVAIVTMDLETAVASVVAAESTSDAPIDAIKAQAVITRSYLISGRGRHLAFDFCDTTHCQFLREPPMPGTSVPRAVDATRGMVLAYNSHPFPAMYTRSCSGHTRTPAQVGLPSNNYPYYSADCKYCLSHPSRWISRISLKTPRPFAAQTKHPGCEQRADSDGVPSPVAISTRPRTAAKCSCAEWVSATE